MLRCLLALSALLVLAAPVLGIDGRLEISQACASVGCISGDAADFPVTIDGSAGHSYVLTSDLTVTDPNLDGIEISTDGIDVDLNGFTLRGPVTCTGSGASRTCDPGSGLGVSAGPSNRNRVRNGKVTGFASGGVNFSNGSAEAIVAEANGGHGIEASSVRHSKARENAGAGIDLRGGLAEGCESVSNSSAGIRGGLGSVIRDNHVSFNAGRGIDGTPDTVITGNTSRENFDVGISTGVNAGGIERGGNSCRDLVGPVTDCP